MINIKNVLQQAVITLQASSPGASLDAEVLLAHVISKSRSYLYSHPEHELTSLENKTYQTLIEKRAQGAPVAYLTGTREFWSLPLKVSEHTLIPRPATETLIEVTLQLLKHVPGANILDLGTGSGAIAIALAKERPDWKITACDRSEQALKIAKDNAKRLNLGHIHFHCSDWFKQLPSDTYHAILSNPPYIAKDDPHLQQGDLRFEPHEALVSGEHGLEALLTISGQSYSNLKPSGFLLLEHAYHQKATIRSILKRLGYTGIQTWKDGEGHDRISGGQRIN